MFVSIAIRATGPEKGFLRYEWYSLLTCSKAETNALCSCRHHDITLNTKELWNALKHVKKDDFLKFWVVKDDLDHINLVADKKSILPVNTVQEIESRENLTVAYRLSQLMVTEKGFNFPSAAINKARASFDSNSGISLRGFDRHQLFRSGKWLSASKS